MKKLSITKEQFEKSKYFNNKYGKLEYVSESGKVFKTEKGKILKFTKESSTDDLYGFYEWLKSNTELDNGIHVKFYDNEDGSGSVEMRFDDRYQWDDDVEDGNLPKDEDSGVKDWIAQFERKAAKNGWEFDMDEYEDEFSLTLRGSDEYQEGTESNPRFKCMEALNTDDIYENKAWYKITLEDEDGKTRTEQIDVTEEDYWGNINTVDGTCYFPSGEEFDGIGYGNDEDGYEKIVKVVDMNTSRSVPLPKWAEFIDSLAKLFSDM